MRRLLIALFWMAWVASSATAMANDATEEIDHLLVYLERSNCTFYRNGSWHGPAAARAHLTKKYRYLLQRNRIQSAEDFIARAATKSSVSGNAYRVKCGASASIPSAAWFRAELERFRNNGSPSPSPKR